jgi:hypothetical protein
MLQGKIVHDGGNYVIKMGGVTINITHDVCALIEQESAHMANIITQERARLAATLERYTQIVNIVLADPISSPVGGQGGGNPWAPTG